MIVWLMFTVQAALPKIPKEEELLQKDHIEILGDQMECVDDVCTVTNQQKDVVATHHGKDGTTKLTAKELILSKSKAIDAIGNVNVLHTPKNKKQKPIHISSDKAHYANKLITMTGNVIITQDGHTVKGERGEADIETKRVKVFGGKGKSASAHFVQEISS